VVLCAVVIPDGFAETSTVGVAGPPPVPVLLPPPHADMHRLAASPIQIVFCRMASLSMNFPLQVLCFAVLFSQATQLDTLEHPAAT
jgi:hypothetical protein